MWELGAKVLITGLLAVGIAEIAKRNTTIAAVVASIPFTSVVAMIWLYVDTRSAERVAALATGIFWLILPSFVLFLGLPMLLRAGIGFWPSLAMSIGMTVLAYALMMVVVQRLGLSL